MLVCKKCVSGLKKHLKIQFSKLKEKNVYFHFVQNYNPVFRSFNFTIFNLYMT